MDMVDIAGLRKFSRMPDRDRAPFLVGRTDEVNLVNQLHDDAFGYLCDGEISSSMTALLQGAPGVGKTSLLNHMKRRWRTEKSSPIVVETTPQVLADEGRLAVAIAEAVRAGASRVWRTEHSAGRIGRASFMGLGADISDGMNVRPSAPRLEDIGTVLRTRNVLGPDWIWERPVVLMVDEIQSLPTEAGPVVQALHMGVADLPLVPLFAGLGDSLEILEGFTGTSRLTADNVLRLGALETRQATGVVETMFRTYGVRGADAARAHWADWAAEVSDAWPQHLHNAMRAIARGLLETGGRLDDIDADAVRERERTLRLDVYGRRQSTSMREAVNLVAAVMRDCPTFLTERVHRPNRADMLASILRHRRTGETPEDVSWRLPTDPDSGAPMDAKTFLRHLVHRGSLQERGDKRMECPIPTFRDFLIESGDPVPALEHRTDLPLPEISANNMDPALDGDADPSP